MPSVLTIRVQPRASSNRLSWNGELLKVYTTSPPVDGEANDAVIHAISKAFHIPKSSIQIDAGHKSRDKRLLLESIEPDALLLILSSLSE
ncbi:MAG: DUF167 domain-containing protein [Armatimonadetes bacterium]|nr:DUF167 domain-containing protein [Armatimonadota bacterium]